MYPSVTWYGKAESVSIICSFDNWKNKIKLVYCPLRKLFVRYFNGLTLGQEFEFKFIVDGSY